MCKGPNDRPGQRHCSSCHKSYQAEWRKQKTLERNPVIEAVKRDRRIKEKYDLSPDGLEAMLMSQGYACEICATEFGDEPINCYCVDHDHATGYVRGLLCRRCNQALGMLEDEPRFFDRAAHYLRVRSAKIEAPKPKVTMASILERLGEPETREAAE
jgi:hypothetical protein